jgi:hypothetical protein
VFSALLEARPDDKPLWIGRGRYHALCDRWRPAAADYSRGIEPVPTPGAHEYYEYACLLLLVGDKEHYRGLIQTLGDQVDKTKDPRLSDGAVPGGFAADWMTIQIYRREVDLLFIDPSQKGAEGPAHREAEGPGQIARFLENGGLIQTEFCGPSEGSRHAAPPPD